MSLCERGDALRGKEGTDLGGVAASGGAGGMRRA